MKRVLLVTHDFPPVGGPGVQRAAKFAKYLPRYGWEISVLTVQTSGLVPQDRSQLGDVRGLRVHRTPAPSPYRAAMRLGRMAGLAYRPEEHIPGPPGKRVGPWDPRAWLIPDGKILWVPFGVAWAVTRKRSDRSDLVLSTIPTPSASVLGWLIARSWHVPHVIDFRDPWAGAWFMPRRAKLARKFEQWLETRVLSESAGAVVAQDKWGSEIRSVVPDNGFLVKIIMNGYDESDFQGVRPCRPEARFVVVHAGGLYDRGAQATNLTGLRLAAELLAERQPQLAREMKFVQIGAVDRIMRAELALMERSVRVSVHAAVPHRQAIAHMLGADVLYLPTFDNIIRAKTFEYLRAGHPILAVGDDLEATGEILARFRSGETFRNGDAAGIAGFLERAWRAQAPQKRPQPRELVEHSREEGARRLAEMLDHVLERQVSAEKGAASES